MWISDQQILSINDDNVIRENVFILSSFGEEKISLSSLII